MEATLSDLPSRMNAIWQPTYGGPEALQLTELDRPALRDDQVLVRGVAASLNKGDWHLLTGKPYLVRAVGFGLRAPKRPIAGMAIAGTVAAVGRDVKAHRVGDAVFGELNRGAFAEYAVCSERELVRKPDGVSFEDAATLPIAATTALQGLRDAGALKAGQSVLVNGASGGVGTFAVQIAKAMGARVTGVCSAANAALVASLGADAVLDYAEVDFTRAAERYDLIFDLIGNHAPGALRRALTENGRIVAAAGGIEHEWFGPLPGLFAGLFGNLFAKTRYVPLGAVPKPEDLAAVAALVAEGKVRPVIDRRYALREVPEAMRYLGTGRSRGKSVIAL